MTVKLKKNAIKEARLAGVKTIALIDTNCDPDLVDYPIPANDDSIKSIQLFIDLFAQAIKGSKKMEAIKALRNTHEATLAKLKSEYESESEKKSKNGRR